MGKRWLWLAVRGDSRDSGRERAVHGRHGMHVQVQ